MKTKTVLALLDIKSLEITNPGLDKSLVDRLTRGLEQGDILPEDLYPIYVACGPNGYQINDGNHRVAALREAGVNGILADVYQKR